jgi:poly(A) polymerase
VTRISDSWIFEPSTQKVCAALTDDGATALFVGGCVRNALLGAPVSDIDIATDATPDRVMQLAKDAGIRAIPTGIDHGTVTLVQDGIPHEITTFRRDVATDGRRAVVAFSTDVAEDAARRDFTMNALYARPDGEILDPLDGLPDLHARRVRFIGNARHRIQEDYLRSMRYFRFHAWYGDETAGLDPEALGAIAENLEGLETLSRERVGVELLKLLQATDPAPAVAAMRVTGVLNTILPGTDDRALALMVHVETSADVVPDSLRRLASLGDVDPMVQLRLSKAQAGRLKRLRAAALDTSLTVAELAYRFGSDLARDAFIFRSALLEQPWDSRVEHQIALGAQAVFPVKAVDLMPEFQGQALGVQLKLLESAWIASGFTLERADLLSLEK